MDNPISNQDLVQDPVRGRQTADKYQRTLPAQPLDADAAAAMCLVLLTDTDLAILPTEDFRELTKRNDALLNAPAAEIRATLARQIILLEAAATRFLTKAATSARTDDSCALMKISLSAQRSLVATLGALHQMTEVEVHALNA